MDEFVRHFFLCHASEDKESMARPLYERLVYDGYAVWYDEAEIAWGDSISKKVNWGLANSQYVIVILTSAFANKHWPNREFNAALNAESASGRVKVLPLLVGSPEEQSLLLSKYPLLSDKRYLVWNDNDLASLLYEINRLIHRPVTSVHPSHLIPDSRLVAMLEQAGVTVSQTPIKELDSRKCIGSLLRPSALGTLELGSAPLSLLPNQLQERLLTGYVHEIFAHNLQWNCTTSVNKQVLVETAVSPSVVQSVLPLLTAVADAYAVARNQIVVLFKETAIVDPHQFADMSTKIVAAGFSVGMSAFGTGFSSLSVLEKMRVSYLLMDESFTHNLGHGVEGEAVVRSIGALCASMGVKSVACGVTTEAQIESLQKAQFDLAECWI